MPDESINIQSVVRRIDDSTNALNELQETIQALGAAQATQERAAESIEGSTSRLLEFINEVSEVCEKVNEANVAVVQALGEAEKFLEGTDLSQMQSQIQGLETQTASIVEMLEGSLQEAHQAASAAEKAREEAESEAQALQTKINSLPERVSRKFNLGTPPTG